MNGFLLVAAGGAVGAMLRYGAGLAAAQITPQAPGLYATLFVNLLGSALMGAVMAWLVAREQTPATDALFLLLAVGLLGGFTTFSAFSLEMAHMVREGAAMKAAAYAGVSVVGGLGAFLAVFFLTRQVAT